MLALLTWQVVGKIGALLAIVLVIVGGIWLAKHAYDKAIADAKAGERAAVTAEVNEASLKERETEWYKMIDTMAQATRKLDELTKRQAAITEKFDAQIARLQKHDLGKLAAAHPGMVAGAVNRGAAQRVRAFCTATGGSRCGTTAAAPGKARPAQASPSEPP